MTALSANVASGPAVATATSPTAPAGAPQPAEGELFALLFGLLSQMTAPTAAVQVPGETAPPTGTETEPSQEGQLAAGLILPLPAIALQKPAVVTPLPPAEVMSSPALATPASSAVQADVLPMLAASEGTKAPAIDADAAQTTLIAEMGTSPAPESGEPVVANATLAPRHASAASTLVRTVATPVGDPRWPEQVGHEVRLLLNRGVQGATLRLTPEHLGPVEVRIDIVADRANVVFGATQAETRAALADALPKLRELFEGSGLALGDAGVRRDAPNGSWTPAGRTQAADGLDGTAEPQRATSTVLTVRLGLVDAYA